MYFYYFKFIHNKQSIMQLNNKSMVVEIPIYAKKMSYLLKACELMKKSILSGQVVMYYCPKELIYLENFHPDLYLND